MSARIRRAAALLLPALTALLTAGCSPSISDVCEDLDDRCADLVYRDCREKGERLSSQAAARGCTPTFDAYFDCVTQAGCDWKTVCAAEFDALNACTPISP